MPKWIFQKTSTDQQGVTLLLLSSCAGNNGNTDTLTLRAFINALAFDVVLTVISPLMLIYSSKDLRQAIKQKFNKRFM